MISYYIKTAIRVAQKNRLYTCINLFGLSVGIACFVIILLFVSQELNYDRFHKNANTIYRINTRQTAEGVERQFAHAYLPLGPLLQSKLPEVEEIVRLLPQSVSIKNGEIKFQEEIYYTDSVFFDVFSFHLIHGNIHTALKDPTNIVITESAARRYFGNANPMGKELIIEGKTPFKVSGILAAIPENSSLRFEFLVPLSSARQVMGSWVFGKRGWHFPPAYTYVKVKKNTVVDKLEEKLAAFSKKDLPAMVENRVHFLQPLTSIHYSSYENEPRPTVNKSILLLFIIVGIVILLLAVFNFINLFLSRLVIRIKEIGIQKVFGAGNRTIWWQIFSEAFLFIFWGLLLSLAWINIFFPVLNAITGREFSLFALVPIRVWAMIVLLLLTVAFLAALFPFIILARLKMSVVLKGKSQYLFPQKRNISLQSFFVIAQFTIAVILIVATVVMQSQIYYIRNKDLGLQSFQTLVIPVRDENIQNNFRVVKNELLSIKGVAKVSAISNFPWTRGFHDFETVVQTEGRVIKSNTPTLLVEEDFISVMGMTVVKGRSFSGNFSTDVSNAFILNETAAAKFGIKDLSGVTFTMSDVDPVQPKQGQLIGIVKDFHLQSLHETIEPLILTIAPASYYLDNIVIRLSGDNIPATLLTIESKLKAIAPSRPVDYFFLDNAFAQLYEKEVKLAFLFNCFSVIAIIIACMGLFGIVSFATARRTKEIGIRKVLGASSGVIAQLLSRDFAKLVLLSFLIASPLAWFLMNQWLESFAYRVTINGWVFILTGMAVLLLACTIMSIQVMKAAMTNPVKSLRAE